MLNVTGQECPVCNKPFTEHDDIVFCPDCGTPHHRACWQELGHCINEDKHADGYTFEVQKTETSEAPGTCPSCGADVQPGLVFCENCGMPLTNTMPQNQTLPFGLPPLDKQQNGTQQAQGIPNMQVFFSNTNATPDKNELIDGISVKDWITFIGPNAGYYLFHFKRMDTTGSKFGATLSAILFAPFYFMYRKMWGIGILSGAINLLLNSPSVITNLQSLGLLAPSFDTAFLSQISFPLTLAMLFVNIIWGLLAVHLYRKNAGKKIKKIKESSTSETAYQATLQQKAGPSRIVFIVATFIMFFSFFNTLI